jgi:hypothetical protein
VFFAITQIGIAVKAGFHLWSGKSIYTPDSLPILNEEIAEIVGASILSSIFVGYSLLRLRSKKATVGNSLERWRSFLGFSLVAYIGVLVALSTIKWCQDYTVGKGATSDAEKWLFNAQREVKPTWIEDDAVTWMKNNDFDLIGKGEGWHRGAGQPEDHYYIVKGEKKLKNAGLLVKPAWMEMTFIFNLNSHQYERVKYIIRRYRFR